VKIIFDIMWSLLVRVSLAEKSGNFSHVPATEAKKIFVRPRLTLKHPAQQG